MWLINFWILIFVLAIYAYLFYQRIAVPRWLLNFGSWYFWFAAMQIGILLGTYKDMFKKEELMLLGQGLVNGQPTAYLAVSMTLLLVAMLLFYRQLFIMCEVKKATFKDRDED